MATTSETRDMVMATLVEAEGFSYVGHERMKSFGRDALSVYIDKPGGVTIEDCGQVSEVLQIALTAEGILGENECLEVSSPGLDRPLFKQADYDNVVGETVQVKLLTPYEGRKRFKGKLCKVLEGAIQVEVDGKLFELALNDIEKANLVYDVSKL